MGRYHFPSHKKTNSSIEAKKKMQKSRREVVASATLALDITIDLNHGRGLERWVAKHVVYQRPSLSRQLTNKLAYIWTLLQTVFSCSRHGSILDNQSSLSDFGYLSCFCLMSTKSVDVSRCNYIFITSCYSGCVSLLKC